jgi:hypothetical protein
VSTGDSQRDEALPTADWFNADQYPQAMNLAYDVVKEIENKNRKFRNSFFGWVKFEIETSKLEDVKTFIDKNANILRSIIVKTVRESTLATLKVAHKGVSRRGLAETEEGVQMDEQAVDKKIDEMIDAEAPKEDLQAE